MHESTHPVSDSDLGTVVQRNINALLAARDRAEKQRTVSDRIADFISAFVGNMTFVYVHVVWFAIWIPWNLSDAAFDPFPFGLLTTAVSLEAIFLTAFVLISQNRQARLNDRQSDLDVQIDLLAEHEITRILCLVTAIAKHLRVQLPAKEDLVELQKDIEPDALLKELEKQQTGNNCVG